MQESRRNTVANITKLATKLQAFPFNDIALAPDPPLRHMVHGTDRFRRRMVPQTPITKSKDASETNISLVAREAVSLCKVCRSPFQKWADMHDGKVDMCDSCQRWIMVDEEEDGGFESSGRGEEAAGLSAHDRHESRCSSKACV